MIRTDLAQHEICKLNDGSLLSSVCVPPHMILTVVQHGLNNGKENHGRNTSNKGLHCNNSSFTVFVALCVDRITLYISSFNSVCLQFLVIYGRQENDKNTLIRSKCIKFPTSKRGVTATETFKHVIVKYPRGCVNIRRLASLSLLLHC